MERRAEKERQVAENFQWDQGKSLYWEVGHLLKMFKLRILGKQFIY
jgi:hypothetical protein